MLKHIMNKCIFIDGNCDLSIREIQEQYRPQGSQALVEVDYSGINPADIAHARHLGMNNNVCGYEFCGTVIETGPTSRYVVGDVIFGSNEAGKNKQQYHGGHQNFLITESDPMSAKLSVDIPHAHAAALSIMVRTAADALLNQFELPFPAIGIDMPTGSGALVICQYL
jgi:NADPH:quinone reductase-like Zn-dependent oxidoreductase